MFEIYIQLCLHYINTLVVLPYINLPSHLSAPQKPLDVGAKCSSLGDSVYGDLCSSLHQCACASLLLGQRMDRGSENWPFHLATVIEGTSVLTPTALCLVAFVLPPVLVPSLALLHEVDEFKYKLVSHKYLKF